MMSLYNISKLPSAVPVQETARKFSQAETTQRTAGNGVAVDRGVSVQTGARVSAGPIPIDENRVEQIRAALRDGSYPIVPTRITDAMIAARLMLRHGR